MKTQRIFIAIFLTLCMLVNNVSPAYALPPLPSSFYGTAKINGANAPAGTIVSAWINGVKYSQATVMLNAGEMWFGLDVAGDDPATSGVIEGGAEGNTVAFMIGDLAAPQTGIWHTGTNERVDLAATQPFPPVITEGDSINVTMSEDGSPTAFSLTLNATDGNGDTLTWSISTSAGHGTASASGTGTSKAISYTPAANYNGADSFVVQVSDGSSTDAITVNVTIEPVNDAPVANDQSVSTPENTPKSITLVGSDVENAPLDYFIVALPTHGTLSGVTPNLTYTPAPNYDGTDSFNFKVNDGELNSNTATVTITVDLVNVAPVCSVVSLTTNEDTIGETAPSCTDGDGDPLTYSIVASPSHGTADVLLSMLQYSPTANYNGPDSFTYRAYDGLAYSNAANVTVTVTAVNDPPVALGDTANTPEDIGAIIDVLVNDTDVDGDTLTFANYSSQSAQGGIVACTFTCSYIPPPDFFGTDSFTYQANDGLVDSNIVTVYVTVYPVNDAPVAVADVYDTPEDTVLNIAAPGVLTNDSDVDGDSLTAIKVGNPSHGTVTLNSNGSFTYTPAAFFNGTDSFTYKVNDGHMDGNTVTVTINVSSVNNASVCSPVSLNTAEDTTGQADPSCTDADGNPLTYSIVAQPAYGTASVVAGKLVYTPSANYFGPDSFTYKASDGLLDSNTATVTVTVTAVNDAPVAVNDTFTATEDTAKTLPVTGVGSPAENDTDVEGNSLTVTAVSSPVGGTVGLASGTITFTPTANLCGSGAGSFTYTVSDGNGGTDTGVVTLNIACINDAPVAVDDTYTAVEDTVKTLPASGAGSPADNDTDVDGGTLTVTAVSSPVGGTVALATDTITFTPNANLCGSGAGSFAYTVSDGNGGTDSGVVSLDIACVNDAPVAVDDTFTATEDTVKTLPASGAGSPAANDTDIDGGTLTVTAVSSPVGGTVSLVTNTITFTPTADLCGPGAGGFTYLVSDGNGGMDSGVVILDITCTNDAPVAVDDTFSATEDTVKTLPASGVGSPAENDADIDGDVLTVTAVSSPVGGTVNLAGGTITFTPTANLCGTGAGSFQYTVSDGHGGTDIGLVTLNVTCTNDAPVAVADVYATPEDTTLNVSAPGVLSNDTDVDGNPLTAVKVSDPLHGTLTLNANGSFTYVPASLFNGTDSFTYKANDSTVDGNVVTVTINVSSVNNPPVAVDDTFSATEDTAKTFPVTGVGSPAANDTDLDGDALTVTAVSTPTGGTVNLAGGMITFTPTANLCGDGAGGFAYTVADGNGGTDTGLVTLDIVCVNDAPVANAQSVNVTEDTPRAITLSGSDVDGDALTFTVTVNPTHGTLTGTAPNVTYTPVANYNGPDSFSFKVNDGTVDSAPATVTITVTAVNDAPVADDQTVTTNEDTAEAITLTGSDVDAGTTLTYTILAQPAHGTLSGTAPNVTYTPDVNYNGADSFTFRVNDGSVNSNTATVTITVTAVNDVPVANAQSVTTGEDTAKAITLTGSDVETITLTFAIVTGPAHGTLNGTAPDLTYTPDLNYNGADSFTFKVNDGTVDSAPATVSIAVTAVNDVPVANAQAVTTNEDTAKPITLTGSDVESTVTFSIVTGPAHGTLTGTAPNITYTPVANYNGSDSFTFKVNDGTVDSALATVTITVTAANDAPVANAQSVTTDEDTAKSITLNGSDVDEDSLNYSVLTQPAHGALMGTAPNITYTPDANYNGPDSFTFKVNDGTVDSAAATVTITVTAVNDVPVADTQSVTTNEDTPKAITLTGTDADAGPTLIFSIVAGPTHGTLSGTGANQTYTSAANYHGSDSFTFKVNDGTVDSAPATVSITVTSVNDAPVAVADVYATPEDTALNVSAPGVLGNDTDVEGSSLTAIKVSDPSHGTLTLNANGSFTYTPNPLFNGSDSFTYKANDGVADSNVVTVTINVSSVNNAPVCSPVSLNTAEDANGQADPSCNDVDGNTLEYFIVAQPGHGTASVVAGKLVYAPATNYNGPDSFTYKANDGVVDSNVATVTVTVTAVNDIPVADAQSVTTSEDTAKSITLTGSDVESAVTFAIVTGPAHGTLSGSAPDVTYTPAANYNGPDSFTFKVNDGTVDSAPATVTITVTSVNDVPVANAQSATTAEDTAKSITLTGSDVESTVTFSIVTGPSHGTLSGTAPAVTYTPAANYNGSDSFTFKVNDGTVDSAPATVSITVTAVNDIPVANAQSVTTNEDTAKAITLTGLDVESAITFSIVTGPAHGTLSGVAPDISYTPASNYNGPDSFTFKVNDGTVDSATATVSITVTSVNDVPVANPQSVTTNEDTVKAITLTGSDVESTLTFLIRTSPTHGTLSGSAPNVTYTPNANYNGSDSFTFKVNDGTVDSAPATVSITVTSVNDAPVAVADVYATPEDTTLNVSAPGVLGNDTDFETSSLTAIKVSDPSHGTLTLNANGSFTYVPAALFNGSDSFTYKANDGTEDSNVVTVTINVSSINNPPVAVDDTFPATEDTAKTFPVTGAGSPAANDTDSDGDILTVSAVSSPVGGTVTLASGTITFTPTANLCGTGAGRFAYTVSDGHGGVDNGLVTLNIACINDAPVATSQSVSTNEDTAKAITLTGNDVDGDGLTFSILAQPTHGTLTGSAPEVTYTPASNYTGPDSFTFRVNDGTANSNTATVTITVTAVNDAPVANAQSVTTPEDTAKAITLTGSDVDGGTLTYSIVTQPAHGTLSGTAPGVTYTPAANYNDSDSFTFKVNDGTADSAPATVTITVTAVNDAPVAVDDAFPATEDTTISLPTNGAGSPAANDTDADGDALTVASVSSPLHGTVTLSGVMITFTPNANVCGTGGFQYVVSDGHGGVDTGVVTLNIACVNDAPVANAQSVMTNEDTAKAITLSGSDVDTGTTLTYAIVTQPAHGSLSGSAPNVTYTPAANYNGPDSFTFKVNDGTVDSSPATITITVTAVNDAPVANAQSVTTDEDTAKAITLTGSDVEGGTLTYSIVTGPAHGSLTGTPPNVTYIPVSHYHGPDSFTFRINDGSLDSNVATASITVTPKEYTLTVTTVGNGSVTKSPARATYHYGDVVQLSAVADAGWQFSAWSGDLSGTTNPQSITITGDKSVTATFTQATTPKPGVPSLLIPSNGAAILDTTPRFDWSDSNPAAHHYRIQVALTPFFIQPVIDQTDLTISEFTPVSELTPGIIYFWRVQAFSSTGEASNWSSIRYFKLVPQPPTLIAPVNNEHHLSLRPSFDWSDVLGVGYYTIQVSKNGSFTQVVMNELTLSSAFTARKDLPAGKTLYWRVRAESFAGASAWSQTWSFTTPNPPGVPTLISPKYGSVTSDNQPLFKWSKVNVPYGTTFDYYQIQVATDMSFDLPVVDVDINGVNNTHYMPVIPLSPRTKYYWRVRAVNTDGETSSWSSVWTFSTPRPKGPRWRIGVFSASDGYVSWDSNYEVDESLPVPTPAAASGATTRPVLDWSDVSDATGYILQISTEPTFASAPLLASATTTDSDYTVIGNLTSGATVYWRVLMISGEGISNWSSVSSFQVP